VLPSALENLAIAMRAISRLRTAWLITAWLLVLVSEVIALSLSFDINIPAVATQPTLIVRSVASSSLLIRLGISLGAVTATVLLVSASLRRELAGLCQESEAHHRLWWPVAIHLLAYAAFFWSTRRLIVGMTRSSDQVLPVLLWLGFGAGTLGTWLLAAMPIAFWRQVLRRGWRVFLASVVIGLFALEIGQSTGRFWDAFHGSTFRTARALLRVLEADVISRPESLDLGTRAFTVNIAPECSGFEGIGLIWAFLGGYLVLYRREVRFPQALLLLPIGTLVIWLLNVLRIVGLVMVGTWGWPKVALGGFHSQVGWLAFNLVGLGLVAVSRHVGYFSKDQQTEDSGTIELANPTARYLGPFLAVVAAAMITGALSDGQFDRLYVVRVVTAIVLLWLCRQAYSSGTWSWSWSWSAVLIGTMVFLVWMILEPTPNEADPGTLAIPRALHAMTTSGAMLWLAARFLGAVVMVPLIEELAFRGYLLRRLIAADFDRVPFTRFTWASFLVSSLVFGAMHQRWLAGTIAGMFYALVVRRRGQLCDGVVAHATTNLLIATVVLTTGAWSLWT
jgi:exosortase E/protease (VPEID-CTERM system)